MIRCMLLGGGSSNIFLFSLLPGEDSLFDQHFSTGLKPPTRLILRDLSFKIYCLGLVIDWSLLKHVAPESKTWSCCQMWDEEDISMVVSGSPKRRDRLHSHPPIGRFSTTYIPLFCILPSGGWKMLPFNIPPFRGTSINNHWYISAAVRMFSQNGSKPQKLASPQFATLDLFSWWWMGSHFDEHHP